MKSLTELIQKSVENKLDTIIKHFNNKLFIRSLTAEDIQQYFSECKAVE